MKMQINHALILIICTLLLGANSAPASKNEDDPRKSKAMTYYDYIQSEEDLDLQNYVDDTEDYPLADYDNNDLSRTLPVKRRITNTKPVLNSPIYYIRLPPQPYMFVPGLGYVSQPAQTGPGALLNLPVSFISNGKPGTIYQWNGGFTGFSTPIKPAPAPVPEKPKPKPADSKIHRLPGKYVFNGKPNDIFVLGDDYNSIYGDALHNLYP